MIGIKKLTFDTGEWTYLRRNGRPVPGWANPILYAADSIMAVAGYVLDAIGWIAVVALESMRIFCLFLAGASAVAVVFFKLVKMVAASSTP